jgi:hypothetical protein
VRAAIERSCATLQDDDLVWARISGADLLFLERLDDPPTPIIQSSWIAYRDAVPTGTFFWDAARGQLELFEQLGVGAEAARAVFEALDGPRGEAKAGAASRDLHRPQRRSRESALVIAALPQQCAGPCA